MAVRQDNLSSEKAKVTISKKILIALEDTGYAYNFYKEYFNNNYSIPNGELIGIGGATNFGKELKDKGDYDAYIIIYDAGADTKLLNSINNAIQGLMELHAQEGGKPKPIYLFTPKCFEEILFSFTELEKYVKPNLHSEAGTIYLELKKVMKGSYDIDYFVINSPVISEEKKIQDYVKELTKDTVFMYNHGDRNKNNSYMSDCWIKDCCTVGKNYGCTTEMVKAIKNCTPLNTTNYRNKLAFIADHSLLGCLTDILNTMLGKNKKRLKNLCKEKYKNIVKEVNENNA